MTDVRDTKLRARVECCLALPLAHGGVTCLCRVMVVCERAGSARRSAGSVVFVFVCGRRERRHDDHSQRLHSRQSTLFPAGDDVLHGRRDSAQRGHASRRSIRGHSREYVTSRCLFVPRCFRSERVCARVPHSEVLERRKSIPRQCVRRQQPLAAHLRPPACAAEPEAIHTLHDPHEETRLDPNRKERLQLCTPHATSAVRLP